MSTTLTNGIIIPDNGSRNWGGDLANNWNIIDVNVGYITDVKNKVTTLENSVAENTANIQINKSNISALQTKAELSQIIIAKNLTGTNILPGDVVDCEDGNGKLQQLYITESGTVNTALPFPVGKWRSTSFITISPNDSSIFIKI